MTIFFLSSSYKPSRRVRTFLNELEKILPESTRINRGRMNLRQLFSEANRLACKRVLLIFNYKGNPDRIIGYEKVENKFEWSFQWNLEQVKLRFELNTNKINVKPKKWQIKFDGTHLDVKAHLNHFFHPILIDESSNVHQNDFLRINIVHQSPGFKFEVNDQINNLIPPAFRIKEILLPDE